MGKRTVTASRALSVLAMAALLTGCATAAQRQYQGVVSSVQSDDCRALQAVAEERERYSIPVPPGESGDEVVRRCLEGQPEQGSPGPSMITPFRTPDPSPLTEEVAIERRGNTYRVPVRINKAITLP